MNINANYEVGRKDGTDEIIMTFYLRVIEAEFRTEIQKEISEEIQKQMQQAANAYFAGIIREQVAKAMSEKAA